MNKESIKPVDVLDAYIELLRGCRRRCYEWSLESDVHPEAQYIYLATREAFEEAIDNLKKHRRDDLTFQEVRALMRWEAGRPLLETQREIEE